jgi:hypothetical protein
LFILCIIKSEGSFRLRHPEETLYHCRLTGLDLQEKMMSTGLHYFAYGSNMHLFRFRERVPSCRVVDTAYLSEHEIRFHKRSIDGSSKCNAYYTGKESDRIYGVIYEILSDEKRALDRFEFLGKGYLQGEIQVVRNHGELTAFTYFAEEDYLDDSLKPYTWYKSFVVTAARSHLLPESYVEQIEKVSALNDPDRERAERNSQILERL